MIQVSVHKDTGRVTALGHPPSANEIAVMVPKSVDVAFGWVYDERNRSFYRADAPTPKPSILARVHGFFFGADSPYTLLRGSK